MHERSSWGRHRLRGWKCTHALRNPEQLEVENARKLGELATQVLGEQILFCSNQKGFLRFGSGLTRDESESSPGPDAGPN
jgi:hypothetical protein